MASEKKTSCLFCSIGCGVKIKAGEDSVIFGPQSLDELEFDYDNPINLGSLCGRGVSLIELVSHPKRLFSPMIKKDSKMEGIEWDDAFEQTAEKFLSVVQEHGPEGVGIILGPTTTNEEAEVTKDFAEFLDIKNIDFLAPEDKPVINAVNDFPYELKKLDDIEKLADANLSLIIGDLFFGYPILSRRILKAKYDKRGNSVITIDSAYTNTTWFGNVKLINRAGTEAVTLIGIIKKVLEKKKDLSDKEKEIKEKVDRYKFNEIEIITKIKESDFDYTADSLLKSETTYIYLASNYGIFAKSQIVAYFAQVLSYIIDAPFFPLYTGGNSRGLNNVLYNRGKANLGLSAPQMIESAAEGKLKGLLVIGADPVSAFPSDVAEKAVDNLEFLLNVNIFPTELSGKAHVEFPATSFFEKTGSAVNFFGMNVELVPITEPFGQSKSALLIARSFKDYVIKNRWKVKIKGEKAVTPEKHSYDYWGRFDDFFNNILVDETRDKDYFLITHFNPGTVAEGAISKYFWWVGRETPTPCAVINNEDPLAKFNKVRIIGDNGDLVLPVKAEKSMPSGTVSVPVGFKDVRNTFSWEIEENTNYLSVKPEKVKLEGIK